MNPYEKFTRKMLKNPELAKVYLKQVLEEDSPEDIEEAITLLFSLGHENLMNNLIIFLEFEQQIKDFAKFSSPWGNEGNATPNEKTIETALKILETLQQLKTEPTLINRTAEGGITIHIYRSHETVIFEVSPDGNIIVETNHFNGDTINFQEIEINDIHKYC